MCWWIYTFSFLALVQLTYIGLTFMWLIDKGQIYNRIYFADECEDGLFFDPVSSSCMEECPLFYQGNTDNGNCTICKLTREEREGWQERLQPPIVLTHQANPFPIALKLYQKWSLSAQIHGEFPQFPYKPLSLWLYLTLSHFSPKTQSICAQFYS